MLRMNKMQVSIYDKCQWSQYETTQQEMSNLANKHISDECCHCEKLLQNAYFILDMLMVSSVLHGNYIFHCGERNCLKGATVLLRDKREAYGVGVSTLCGFCHKILAESCKCCGACYLTSYCNEECQKSDCSSHKQICAGRT